MNEELFESMLSVILEEQLETEYKAIVGIVQNGDKWLLGLSKHNDDRANHWCFPGGHIKRNESLKDAVEREVHEETGVLCRMMGEPFRLPQKKHVAFVHCKVKSKNQKLKNNAEFSAVGFFTRRELKSLKLYKNVLKLLDRVK